MSTIIGQLGTFDCQTQEWEFFVGRFKQFVKINKIDDENKSAVLLTHLTDETYRLARNLVHPAKVEDVSYNVLVDALGQHFTPKRSTYADRAKFYEATRARGENLEDWAARLRGLAVYCDFGSALDILLCDRFVLGLSAGPERDKLFEQDAVYLTLARALDLGQKMASARGQAPAVKEEPVFYGASTSSVRRDRDGDGARRDRDGDGAPGGGGSGISAGERCTVCGFKSHTALKCKFKNYKCSGCGLKGHLKKVCSVKRDRSRLNNMKEDSDCEECKMYNVRVVGSSPFTINVFINNIQLTMELDSGSGKSVISEKLWLQHFKQYKLFKSDIKMCFYNGHKIQPLGYFSAEIVYENKTNHVHVFVIRNGGPPLLGRDFMTKFNVKFSLVNNMSMVCDVQEVLNRYPDVWKPQLGKYNKHTIALRLKEGAVPKCYKPRPVPLALKSKVEIELRRLVELGILVPVNYSEYATPIVPVLKKDGSVRICGDFSISLNKQLYIDSYPLPRIEDIFAKLGGGDKYTKIDLSMAYNQLVLSEESQDLTTITTTLGLFKYTRLVFGLANAPAIFQRTMESLLLGIDGVSIFLDDICITGHDSTIHLRRLDAVLSRLQGAGFRVQKEKCSLFQDSVTYLGYVINKHGLHTCPGKVEAIKEAPRPTNVTELKRFLGMVNYYRNFIPGASSIMQPLHSLLCSDVAWQWGPRQEEALRRVRAELSSGRVLAHYSPAARIVLTTDAGPDGLGAVLSQVHDGGERPLAFASRSLSAAEKNYGQIHKEAAAIIFGVKRFHQYLYGRPDPFVLKTDHRPLLSIFGKNNGISIMTASRLQRYALFLSAYNYTVEYISGNKNGVADYLSRAPLASTDRDYDEVGGESSLIHYFNEPPLSFRDIKSATETDRVLTVVKGYIGRGWPRKIKCNKIRPYFLCKTELEVEDGCILRGHKVVVPKSLRSRLLDQLHNGHLGIVKTKSNARGRMWWPGIDRDIERTVGACETCAASRPAPPRSPPAPWPQPAEPWTRIHLDYMSQAVAIPQPIPAPTAAAAPAYSLGAVPRTIVIQRPDARHGFGFTLRHLVVYPPETPQDLYEDARHLAVGAVGAPMDTIFVRSVRPGGPAAVAGLRAGDRVLAVNGEPVACGRARAPYARVVQLAQREPRVLRLTVVPRDHDLLQRYFSEAAYNPESNQRPIDMPAPITEHESRLFDAYRKPRSALPAPQAPTRLQREDPEYASVASLAPSRYEPRLNTQILLHDRRESDSSLPSSVTDSKDSLGSFDSNSTLTGRELDDSIILSRIRKSLEQKEAFLRRPSQPTGWVTPDVPPPIKQKEFYARPQKLQKQSWPPPCTSPTASPPPPTIAIPHIQDIRKKDIEDCSASVDSGTYSGYGELNGAIHDKSKAKIDKNAFVSTLSKIHESAPVMGQINGALEDSHNQDNRYPVPELQLVTARTRQLEEARGGGEKRTEVARSELARLSTTRLEPSVALRRKEFETRTSRREARSLDVQPHHDLEHEIHLGGSLSGNQMLITGSKHLHCPPPEGYVPDTEKVQMRARSNSTGSEGLPIRRHHATDGSHSKRRMGLNREQMEAMNRVSLPGETNGHDLEPALKAQRPTQLSLAPSSLASSAATTPASPSPTPSTPADSGFTDDSVTRRQKKEAQLGEEERAMRRVSYLKATWGEHLHMDSDPDNEIDHHLLRSVSGDKKEEGISEVGEGVEGADVEGNVQIKMVVSNGKRASDRSWKQVWAVLHGTKLYLYRHHPSQSPGAVSGAGSGAGATADSGSRDALDVRYSLAALADDYTKRKHVVRVTTVAGAELLLQADGAADAQRWLAALRRHSAEPPPEPAPAPTPLHAQTPPAAESSPLPPQRTKKIGRNRSPTAGPPTPTLPSSPKNKTWKGRMAKQLRRMHGGGGAPAQTSGWLGAPLERCPSDPAHPLVPLAVTLPATAVETFGLRTVGVYRVPGNAAGVTALAAALDRGEPPPAGDPRWADVHVASSLLKAYLRRLPDPLLTAHMYPAFIEADRSQERARQLRNLVQALPEAHLETLRYLVRHLRRVVAHSSYNKMEARNLAIVFGPTLVRAASDDMMAMVNDMSSQCRIIESFLTHYTWYFEEEEGFPPVEPPPASEELAPAPAPSRDLLIHNVKKIESKDVSTRDIVSSIISAANRKIQRKPRSKNNDTKKWDDKRDSPPASPLASPLSSPPPHLTTSLADYDGLPHSPYDRQSLNKMELEALGRGRHEISRHTHTLANFSIDGTGDLVSSLTSTFDRKLQSLGGSSPLDDGSIPYADEGQDDASDERSGDGSDERSGDGSDERSGDNSDSRSGAGSSPPAAARAADLKAAWLAAPRRREPPGDDSEKENGPADSDKDVDTASQTSRGELPDNDKPPEPRPRPVSPADCNKRSDRLQRSESLNRESERGAARVLRSESLNWRAEKAGGEARRRDVRAAKLKRKNGMPERGIKRRHTVGGTKDFDKDGWSARRHTRTSSPELAWPSSPLPRAPLESHV